MSSPSPTPDPDSAPDSEPAARRVRVHVTLPFLAVAYPTTFLLYRGGSYCGPLCFAPTPAGVASVVGGVLGSLALAGLLARVGRDVRAGTRSVRWLLSPPRPTSAVLAGLFVAFLGGLTLDALSLYEPLWKPVALPATFLLFLPVWALYVLTFPLSLLTSAVGAGASASLTLLVRATLVGPGLALSAAWQTLLLSAVVTGLRSRQGT